MTDSRSSSEIWSNDKGSQSGYVYLHAAAAMIPRVLRELSQIHTRSIMMVIPLWTHLLQRDTVVGESWEQRKRMDTRSEADKAFYDMQDTMWVGYSRVSFPRPF